MQNRIKIQFKPGFKLDLKTGWNPNLIRFKTDLKLNLNPMRNRIKIQFKPGFKLDLKTGLNPNLSRFKNRFKIEFKSDSKTNKKVEIFSLKWTKKGWNFFVTFENFGFFNLTCSPSSTENLGFLQPRRQWHVMTRAAVLDYIPRILREMKPVGHSDHIHV